MASAVSVGTVRAAAESGRDAKSDGSGLRTSALEADPGNAARWLFQEAVLGSIGCKRARSPSTVPMALISTVSLCHYSTTET